MPHDRLSVNYAAALMAGVLPRAQRGNLFRYDRYRFDATSGLLTCRYALDDWRFEERIRVPPAGPRVSAQAVDAAAKLVFLLAGVSYYKTAAPARIDLGAVAATDTEQKFLRSFYLDGLGEFAYRNQLDLTDLRIDGPRAAPAKSTPVRLHEPTPGAGDRAPEGRSPRPLVPFGGGIDSIVTVEWVRASHADTALFVANWHGDRFEAIEEPAAVTGLPIVRAERSLDPALDPRTAGDHGFFNGHVPVTGILSAIAVLAAVLTGRNSVVMSNEWSASSATVDTATGSVNHQYSKSLAFEAGFRQLLATNPAIDVDYFSALRPYSELWVAERFGRLGQYHRHFRSCNRAFHLDRGKRLGHWCGRCDKCCFIDLILAPFLPREELVAIFAGREPLADPALADRFRALLGLTGTSKPFECVGDVAESRTALRLAAARPDRTQTATLHLLAGELTDTSQPRRPDLDAAALLQPLGPHFIPADYAPQDLLV